MKRLLYFTLALALALSACAQAPAATPSASGGALPADAAAVAQERGLSQDDIYAALKTYMPSGQTDPFIMFSSGGQAGQVLVIGVPSMRILKVIGVFQRESWQGYGFGGSTNAVFEGGYMPAGSELSWGDTHHPNISEANGPYDG